MKQQILLRSAIAAILQWAGVAAAQDNTAAEAPALEEVIVTGVFSEVSIEDAPISIAAIDSEEIAQQSPVSSADLLKNIPGVFVNSALGETRNIVFSRGVSANSLEAAGGYFYVSLQEDGLPVEPITFSNFGPDYFSRSDIMLERIEGLRGGTSTVTGANAPGGIFNYISRTGETHEGVELQYKYGLEGDGHNPFNRADAYVGGRLGEGDLYYALGGFYRESDGARYPGYALNKGGQLRGNLLWKYDGGSLLFTAKHLDDHNGFFEFLPARNFDDPSIVSGFDNLSSVLPEAGRHTYYTLRDDSPRTWDGSNLVHAQSTAFGLNWNHQLGARFKLDNKLRYSDNRTDWNTVALAFATPLTDVDGGLGALTGTSGLPGTYTYRYRDTGEIAAVVNQVGRTRTIVTNNLPNQDVLAGGVISALAYAPELRSESIQDQLSITGEFGAHTVTLGGYIAKSDVDAEFPGAGGGISTMQNRPRLLDITLALPTGTVYQVTDPAGFGAIGRGVTMRSSQGEQRQYSLFAGDNWTITDALSADIGLRYENIDYDIRNDVLVPFSGNPLTSGGRDGNALTLYDAGRATLSPTPNRTRRDYDFVAGTGSIAYRFNEDLQTYIRYTQGKKAPDFGLNADIDTAAEIANIFYDPQTIQQIELGVKWRNGGMFLQAFPFWSKLTDVASPQIFTYRAGPSIGQSYSPPAFFGQIETLGLEVSGDFELRDDFTLRAALTVQDPQASGFRTWIQGPTGSGQDDTVLSIPDGDADNNPKLMFRGTATYRPVQSVALFATYSYLGKRAANSYNTWYLPAFSTVDVGASFDVFERVRIQANVTNLLDEEGVMSWARSGALLGALDRQGLTPALRDANPNQLFSVIPNQPRAYYLTTSIRF